MIKKGFYETIRKTVFILSWSNRWNLRHGIAHNSVGVLSFSMEKPVVLMQQQMEQSLPLDIFQEKKNNFTRINIFSFLPK